MSLDKGKVMTTDFATGKFSPHGLMEAVEYDGIFVCDITGPFNLEFADAVMHMWAHVFARQPRGTIVYCVTRWHRTMLGTIEALERMRNSIRYAAKRDRSVHVWWVPDDLEGREFMLDAWVKPYREAGIHLEVFSEESAAMDRIRAIRAAASDAPPAAG